MYEDIALSKTVRIKRAVKEHVVLSEPTSTDEYQGIVKGKMYEGQLYSSAIELNEETNRNLLIALDSHDVDSVHTCKTSFRSHLVP